MRPLPLRRENWCQPARPAPAQRRRGRGDTVANGADDNDGCAGAFARRVALRSLVLAEEQRRGGEDGDGADGVEDADRNGACCGDNVVVRYCVDEGCEAEVEVLLCDEEDVSVVARDGGCDEAVPVRDGVNEDVDAENDEAGAA